MRGNGTAYRLLIAVICTAVISPSLHGQEEREYIRKGNRLYKKSEFAGSEGMYRRAQEDGKPSGDAVFNLGDALYRQNRFSEAAEEFSRAVQTGEADSLRQADGLYNLGNSLLKEQKFSESINAYINSLKLNPDNIQAKYNLAYAQDQLKKQEEQQQQQDQQNNQQQQQSSMSREDAKRLLDALAANEKQTQEKVQRDKAAGARVRVIKNW